MIEAELKAHVHGPQDVIRHLEQYGPGHVETYHDTYYDDAAGTLTARDAELRTRTVSSPHDTRFVLTYKGAAIDQVSGSKPEHETRVTDPDAVHAMLTGLGYHPVIDFEKRCRNYEFDARGRKMQATLAFLPELDETFLELETLIQDRDELRIALDDVRAVLHDLGIKDADLTKQRYTEAVTARRARG
ncbi:class IV adenylate cyclase [Streptomyces sp. 4N509B]|uniref:class IV adenylate cyclase n=1 Tax=Streptomyces sp. 4N509B TaxID=3457413 RepID=UPI003FD0CEEF